MELVIGCLVILAVMITALCCAAGVYLIVLLIGYIKEAIEEIKED